MINREYSLVIFQWNTNNISQTHSWWLIITFIKKVPNEEYKFLVKILDSSLESIIQKCFYGKLGIFLSSILIEY